jgi:hypothetical protein
MEADKTKLVAEQQTTADAMWGYIDSHGKWTAGIVQRVSVIETKQNWSLGLIFMSLAKVISPDVLTIIKTFATTATAWFH